MMTSHEVLTPPGKSTETSGAASAFMINFVHLPCSASEPTLSPSTPWVEATRKFCSDGGPEYVRPVLKDTYRMDPDTTSKVCLDPYRDLQGSECCAIVNPVHNAKARAANPTAAGGPACVKMSAEANSAT
jgi:hypothetical protein